MKQQKKNWPAESNMTALKTLSHTLLHLDATTEKYEDYDGERWVIFDD